MFNRFFQFFYKRRHLSLIELMVVMSLIAIISASIAYNIQGSLEKGRYFRSNEGAKQIEQVLYMHMAESGDSISKTVSNWKKIVFSSPIIKDPNAAIVDGWGKSYKVKIKANGENETIYVTSDGIQKYMTKGPRDKNAKIQKNEKEKDLND